MRKLGFLLLLSTLLFASCRKEHYDVSNVNGVNAEGELLLPLASKSFTVKDMIERFKMDSLVECSESGALSYGYFFEDYDVINGQRLLRFKDLNYTSHKAFENPFPSTAPIVLDTMLDFEHSIVFESNDIKAYEAVMKTGRFDFMVESNIGTLKRIVLRSPELRDESGQEFVLDAQVQNNAFGFDLAGLHYLSTEANSLTLSLEMYWAFHLTIDPELFVNFRIEGRDLAMSSIRGMVNPYSSRNTIDTYISLFPDNFAGMLEMEGVSMKLRERNTFPLEATLLVDTVMMTGEEGTFTVFDPMPLRIDLPSQNTFDIVFDQSINGKINANGGRLYTSSEFIVNPSGSEETIEVADTCRIDVRADLEIPFSFRVDEVSYLDTLDVALSNLEMPDMIESITLGLTFTSTLPLSLDGHFYMYDSETETITGALIDDTRLIQASFDGQPTATTVEIEITEEKIERLLHSDRIIMSYALDTEAHDVKLNANQQLEISMKAKVKYNATVGF